MLCDQLQFIFRNLSSISTTYNNQQQLFSASMIFKQDQHHLHITVTLRSPHSVSQAYHLKLGNHDGGDGGKEVCYGGNQAKEEWDKVNKTMSLSRSKKCLSLGREAEKRYQQHEKQQEQQLERGEQLVPAEVIKRMKTINELGCVELGQLNKGVWSQLGMDKHCKQILRWTVPLLYVSHNQEPKILKHLSQVKQLPVLKQLHLANNLIQSLDWLPRVHLPRLTLIDLHENCITNFAPLRKLHTPSLTDIRINGNKSQNWLQKGLQELRAGKLETVVSYPCGFSGGCRWVFKLDSFSLNKLFMGLSERVQCGSSFKAAINNRYKYIYAV